MQVSPTQRMRFLVAVLPHRCVHNVDVHRVLHLEWSCKRNRVPVPHSSCLYPIEVWHRWWRRYNTLSAHCLTCRGATSSPPYFLGPYSTAFGRCSLDSLSNFIWMGRRLSVVKLCATIGYTRAGWITAL